MDPTLPGFITFIQNVIGISATYLPTTSPIIQAAYQIALDIVNQNLECVGSSSPAYPTYYALAVYNLAADRLVNYAPDQPGQTYFVDLRKNLNLAGFVSGVISSSGDETTNESMVVPEAMKNLTFSDLQTLKTPWGRTYLGLAQAYGPAVWGMS